MRFRAASASVLGREAVRELDRRTIAAGTPSIELMERAGAALAEFVARFHANSCRPTGLVPRALVISGPGNNGGDGYVVARLLKEAGWECEVSLAKLQPPRGDALECLARWNQAGGRCIGHDDALDAIRGPAPQIDVIVDALYGTGLTRPVEGEDAELIHCLNDSRLPIVSADIPSGLCSNTGVPLGIAVRARATLALGAAKPGLFLAEGPDYAGCVEVADIGLLDPSEAGIDPCGFVIDACTTAGCWPRLATRSHKGTRGHVLIVAGSRGKTGAAVLAARGALRAGAGLVTVASVAEVQAAVSAAIPEAMTQLLAGDDAGRIAASAVESLAVLASNADAIVVGPGLGLAPAIDAAVARLCDTTVPIILDADALTAVASWAAARREGVFRERIESGAPPAVLTPHPGEMARLAATTGGEVQRQRDIVARKLATQLGAIVVLKGAATIVCDADRLAYNLSGNPGMACAGMGDVLSGICGAIAARKSAVEAESALVEPPAGEYLDPFERACLAVYVHGAAGDCLCRQIGPGFLASELADRIPAELAGRMAR